MQILSKIVPKSNLGIAFSGGADSIAAAHIFRKFHPTLYHFNHSLYLEDDEIEKGARFAAQQLCLPFVTQKGTVEYKGGSVEAWCREQRYAWFRTLGGTLITGHNLSEATEGYVLNCLRGCPEHIPIPIQNRFDKTDVIRPLILISKQEILDFLKRNDLDKLIVEDFLNSDLTRRRNWVRLSLLPQIREKTNLEKVVKKRYLKILKNEQK
jgi:tRNA(Ile)-lysidine synthetase-like protein